MSSQPSFTYPSIPLSEYSSQLEGYTKDELNEHSMDVGVVPYEPRDKLIAELETLFAQQVASDEGRDKFMVPVSYPEEKLTPFVATEGQHLQPWKLFVNRVIEGGITYGQAIPTDQIETVLKAKRDEVRFAFIIHQIRSTLLRGGMYLTARGQKGEAYIVLPAAENVEVMEAYSRKASDALRNGIILGSNTDQTLLSNEEARRHNSTLEKLAHKTVLLGKSEQAWQTLSASKKNRKILTVEV